MPKTPKAKAAKSAPKKAKPAPKSKAIKPVAKKSTVKAKAPSKATKPVSKPAQPKTKVPAKKKAPVKKALETKKALPPQMELIRRCVRALDDKKAEGLRVLHVGDKSSVTDYFIIATGNSEPHLRALRIAVEKELDDAKEKIVGVESQPASGWCVVDAFDVMIHIFLQGQRDSFRLETLWKDGVDVPVASLLK
ncbi:MAG: ribosome silencing factor [Puniceicoccales bacterium]|jgi:ribosome-associated protein|nr:ribosome silencing factor [Puniceicoccales bacterium]